MKNVLSGVKCAIATRDKSARARPSISIRFFWLYRQRQTHTHQSRRNKLWEANKTTFLAMFNLFIWRKYHRRLCGGLKASAALMVAVSFSPIANAHSTHWRAHQIHLHVIKLMYFRYTMSRVDDTILSERWESQRERRENATANGYNGIDTQVTSSTRLRLHHRRHHHC